MSAKKSFSVFYSKKKNKRKKQSKSTVNTCKKKKKNITLNKVNSISDLKLWMYCNPMTVMQLFSSVFAFYKHSVRDSKTQQLLQNTSASLKKLEENGGLLKSVVQNTNKITAFTDDANNYLDNVHTAIKGATDNINSDLQFNTDYIVSGQNDNRDMIINAIKRK